MRTEEGTVGTVTAVSRDDLIERRRAILERLGLTYEELLARAEAGMLVGDEYEALDDLKDIAFLLGDE